jgi:hypothetical protein
MVIRQFCASEIQPQNGREENKTDHFVQFLFKQWKKKGAHRL